MSKGRCHHLQMLYFTNIINWLRPAVSSPILQESLNFLRYKVAYNYIDLRFKLPPYQIPEKDGTAQYRWPRHNLDRCANKPSLVSKTSIFMCLNIQIYYPLARRAKNNTHRTTIFPVCNKWIHEAGQELIKPCTLEYQEEGIHRKLPQPVPKSSRQYSSLLLHKLTATKPGTGQDLLVH